VLAHLGSILTIGTYQRIEDRLPMLKTNIKEVEKGSGDFLSSQIMNALVHSVGYFFAYPLLYTGCTIGDLVKINDPKRYLNMLFELPISDNYAKYCEPYTKDRLLEMRENILTFLGKFVVSQRSVIAI
ncbi:MAG: hypothetical protein ACFFCQ_07240, partial [Promethearchaeota archaeon]